MENCYDPDSKIGRAVIRSNILHRDNGFCVYCGEAVSGKNVTVDHLIPKKYRGPFHEWNLVLACRPCNNRRASTYPPPPTVPWQWEATYLRESLPATIEEVPGFLKDLDRKREWRKLVMAKHMPLMRKST